MRMKKLLKILVLFVLLFGLVVADIVILPMSYHKLDFVQRWAVDRINTDWQTCQNQLPENKRKLMNYDEALNCLNWAERVMVERFFAIDPKILGFKGPFFSKDPVTDVVTVPAKEFIMGDKTYNTGVNFIPTAVNTDYERMMAGMQQDLGKRLYVDSAYRAPGYQAILFFQYLANENDYSLMENAKWVAMPGYSEHGAPQTAIDFINEAGISGEGEGQTGKDFEALPEFRWLQTNASKYNFYLTYPEGNEFGVGYEPWHWHWEQKV